MPDGCWRVKVIPLARMDSHDWDLWLCTQGNVLVKVLGGLQSTIYVRRTYVQYQAQNPNLPVGWKESRRITTSSRFDVHHAILQVDVVIRGHTCCLLLRLLASLPCSGCVQAQAGPLSQTATRPDQAHCSSTVFRRYDRVYEKNSQSCHQQRGKKMKRSKPLQHAGIGLGP